VAQHYSKNYVHLHVRECRPDTPASPTTERNPGGRRGFCSDEAIWVEALGLREEVGIAVYLADADDDRIPALNHPLTELENLWIDVATS